MPLEAAGLSRPGLRKVGRRRFPLRVRSEGSRIISNPATNLPIVSLYTASDIQTDLQHTDCLSVRTKRRQSLSEPTEPVGAVEADFQTLRRKLSEGKAKLEGLEKLEKFLLELESKPNIQALKAEKAQLLNISNHLGEIAKAMEPLNAIVSAIGAGPMPQTRQEPLSGAPHVQKKPLPKKWVPLKTKASKDVKESAYGQDNMEE